MEEFLRQNYTLITHFVEILAAVTGLLYLKKYKGTAAIFFIYFLVYIMIIDTLGDYPKFFYKLNKFYLIKDTVFEKNRWWLTICWWIGAILFYSYYFRRVLTTKKYVSILKLSTYTFLVFSVVFIAINWQTFFVKSFPSISIFGAVIIFLCVILYFIEILQSERILTFYKSINFYIAVTILIWWLIITPLVFYDVYFSTADWDFIILKWQIYLFANIFMYLTFAFALIWCKPQTN